MRLALNLTSQVPRHEELTATRPAFLRQPSSAKASFLSPSSSFEADDEDSLFGPSRGSQSMQSESERDKRKEPPRYSGEDTRLTSKKELSGWYSYGFAAEVFVVCGIGMLARNARNTQNIGLITS